MIAWLGVPLTLFTVYFVFHPPFGLSSGLQVFWVTVPLAAYVLWKTTEPAPERDDDAIERFRHFEVPDEASTEARGESRPKSQGVERTRTVALRPVVAAPYDLAVLLDRLGGGSPRKVFELHPRIAFVTILAANELSVSDHVTLLLRLEEAAPSFSVRPFAPAEAPPPDLIAFKKDGEFSQRFQVLGKDAKGVKSFLSAVIRDALLDMPEVWVEVQGKAMSVSLFGPFDVERARQLVELADVLFAEYGAEGGPSLLEPSGEVVKKKGKKKKKGGAPAVEAAT